MTPGEGAGAGPVIDGSVLVIGTGLIGTSVALALRRADVGRIAPGCRADLVVLEAPSYTHFVYRPGVPLIRSVIEAGSLT